MINRLFYRCSWRGILFLNAMLVIVSVATPSLARQGPNVAGDGQPETDVVLVLDNSGSMKRNDPSFLIRRAVSGFAHGLSANSRLGIALFDSKAKIILELIPVSQSDFGDRLNRALDQIDYRGQRTDIPGGLELAVKELESKGAPGADSIIVFLTDGIVDLGSRTRDLERSRYLRTSLLPEIKAKGIRVYGVALSKAADLQLVQNLSLETQGDYLPVLAGSEILPAFHQINLRLDALSESRRSDAESRIQTGDMEMDGEDEPVTQEPEKKMPVEEKPEIISDLAPEAGTDDSLPVDDMQDAASEQSEIQPDAHPLPVESVVQPAQDGNPPDAGGIGNGLLIGAGIFMVIALALAVFFVLRRKKETRDDPPRQAIEAMEAVLVDAHADPDAEKRYTLGSAPVRIGRSKRTNDIVIDQSTVSSQHAVINQRDGKYYLRDLGSTNGTFVNDDKVGKPGQTSEVCLRNGDVVSIARYPFQFRCNEISTDTVGVFDLERADSTVVSPTIMMPPKPGDQTVTVHKAVMCPNHPRNIGNEVCTACKKVYCSQCMEDYHGQWLCSHCRSGAA